MSKIVKPILKVAKPPAVSTAIGSAIQEKEPARLTSEARACGVATSEGKVARTAYTSRPMPTPQPRMAMRKSRKVLR